MYIFHPLVFIHRYIYIFLYAPCFKAKLYMMILFYFHNLKIHIFHIIINIPTERDKMCDKIMLWAIFIFFFVAFFIKEVYTTHININIILYKIYIKACSREIVLIEFLYIFFYFSLLHSNTHYTISGSENSFKYKLLFFFSLFLLFLFRISNAECNPTQNLYNIEYISNLNQCII